MIAASTPSSLRCPICGTWSVRPMEGRIRWRSPSHRCAQCATRLRAELSIRALWAVPVGVLACVRRCPSAPPARPAAANGGIADNRPAHPRRDPSAAPMSQVPVVQRPLHWRPRKASVEGMSARGWRLDGRGPGPRAPGHLCVPCCGFGLRRHACAADTALTRAGRCAAHVVAVLDLYKRIPES